MSFITRNLVIGFIAVQVLLVDLRCHCVSYYDKYTTAAPRRISCGGDMECVPPHVCVNGSVATGGENLIGIRIDCPSGTVCCRVNSEVSSDENSSEESDSLKTRGCGYINRGGIMLKPKQIPGQSEFGEFPWALAVLHNEDFIGGASLIHPRMALTAAHIVANAAIDNLIVRAGEWTHENSDEPLPHQDRQVSEIIIHEQFNKSTLFNDVALLFLKDAFQMNKHIQTVCLPSKSNKLRVAGCFFTGWGQFSNTSYPSYLKKIRLDVVNNPECQKQLRQTHLGWYFELHDSFMCAGARENNDVCNGDGGSPLVCESRTDEDRYYQTGVSAWGLEPCGKEGVPDVYASVVNLHGWVKRTVSAKGLDSSTFTAE